MQYRARAVIPLVVMVFIASPSRAARLTCLTGTDSAVVGDISEIAATRGAIDSTCICSDFDGTPGKSHRQYVDCAWQVVKQMVANNSLRAQCKMTVKAYYAKSTCGRPARQDMVPCVTRTAKGQVRCGIRNAARCSRASRASACRGFSACIGAADTNGDGLINHIDTGSCAIDPQEATDIFSTMSAVSNDIPSLIASYGADTARAMVIDELKQQATVAVAEVSSDGSTVSIVFSNGLSGALLVNEPGTWGYPSENSGLVASSVANACFQDNTLPCDTTADCNSLGACFPLGEPEIEQIYQHLNQDTCLAPNVAVLRNADVSVDFLKSLWRYGIISLSAHGGVTDVNDLASLTGGLIRDQVFLDSAERAELFTVPVLGYTFPTTHFSDWYTGRLVLTNNNHFAITPGFVSYYSLGHRYPNSLVLLTACHSWDNLSLANAFFGSGAGAVLGWTETVTAPVAAQAKDALLTQMIDQNQSVTAAYAAVLGAGMGRDPKGGQLHLGNVDDLHLPNAANACGTGTPSPQTPTDTPTRSFTPTPTDTPSPTPTSTGAVRFVDNGDGTITDNQTGLMWEKKSDDGSIHDKDNFYTWGSTGANSPDGTASTIFLTTLNATGFAGHSDWRLPSEEGRNAPFTGPKELESILEAPLPPVFDTGCTPGCTVTDCSCTPISFITWSATSYVSNPLFAWHVSFGTGAVSTMLKAFPGYARAVRSSS